MRVLHVARVFLHYALRNAVPLIALVTFCLLAVAVAGAFCCGASTPDFAQSCCDYAMDCSGNSSPFALPSVQWGVLWSDAIDAVTSWLRALTGA